MQQNHMPLNYSKGHSRYAILKMAPNIPKAIFHFPYQRHAQGPTKPDLFYVRANDLRVLW
jgi:hypothetical protein